MALRPFRGVQEVTTVSGFGVLAGLVVVSTVTVVGNACERVHVLACVTPVA